MPSDLVPEKRFDKNGRLVTRHVKPSSATDSQPAMPRPALTSQKHHDELVQEAVSYVYEILQWHEDKQTLRVQKKACRESFPELQDSTLERIADYGRGAEHDMDAVYEYQCVAVLAAIKADDTHYRHFMLMEDELAMAFDVTDPEQAVALTLILKNYDKQLDMRPEIPRGMEERTDYYRALVGVTLMLEEALQDDKFEEEFEERDVDDLLVFPPILYTEVVNHPDTPPSPTIDDKRIFDLVIEHVDRADDLIDFIVQRKEVDPSAMESYLRDHPRSIAEGSL